MLLLPLAVTLLAFFTLANVEPDALVVGTPLVQLATATAVSPTPTPTLPDPNILYEAGLTAYEAGDFAEAEAIFRDVLTQMPDEVDLYNSLALALAQQARSVEAIEMLETAVSIDPTYAPALYNLGLLYIKNDHVEEAKVTFEIIITTSPTSQWATQAQEQLKELQNA